SINSDKNLVGNLLQYSDLDTSIDYSDDVTFSEKRKVIIIDDFNSNLEDVEKVQKLVNEISEDTIVIFPNTNKKFVFYSYPNKDIFNKLIPIQVNLYHLDGELEMDNMIYIFS